MQILLLQYLYRVLLLTLSQKQRSNLQKEFTQWLQDCHEKHDKQVKFKDYKGTVTRTDVPKRKQHPWATFSSIEWDGRVYKTGQLVSIFLFLVCVWYIHCSVYQKFALQYRSSLRKLIPFTMVLSYTSCCLEIMTGMCLPLEDKWKFVW